MKPCDAFNRAASGIARSGKLGIDATKKLPGERFNRPWPPLINMDEAVKAKVAALVGNGSDNPLSRG